MQEFIVPKLPDTVTHAFIDSDPLAYEGAFGVQKARYKYRNIVTGDETLLFENAKQGKLHLSHEEEKAELFGYEFDPKEWIREKVVVLGSEQDAINAAEAALKRYLKHVPNRVWQGFFTEKGVRKSKDVDGTEKRYQGNRDQLIAPVHHKLCRDHLLAKPEMKMVKGNFEADSIVIALAENKGLSGCLMSLDKDLKTAEKTYVIDMSYDPPLITIAHDGVGGLWVCPIKSKPKVEKVTGVGFKWLCLQIAAGDSADGYHGIKGVGQKSVLAALQDCKTHKECLETLYKTFYEPHGDFEYTSWDNQEMRLTPAEMLLQHASLAYQERSPRDRFTFEKYGMTHPDKAPL